MIRFEEGCAPDPSIEQSWQRVAGFRDKIDKQRSRLSKQRSKLLAIDGEIDELLNDPALSGDNPDAMVKVRKQIQKLRDKRCDEENLYAALEQSVENLKNTLSEATASFSNSCKSIVATAAKNVDEEVTENLRIAMQDYCAAFYAKRNGFTMMGAQFEMEKMTFDKSIEQAAQERIHRVYDDIRAEVRK